MTSITALRASRSVEKVIFDFQEPTKSVLAAIDVDLYPGVVVHRFPGKVAT